MPHVEHLGSMDPRALDEAGRERSEGQLISNILYPR